MKKKILCLILALCVLAAFVPCVHAAKVNLQVKKVVTDCALLEDGSVWTWGDCSGNGTWSGSNKPQKIMENVKDIYYYGAHYALKEDNSLWGWGLSSMIGDGTANNAFIPVKIADNVKQMCGIGYILKTDNSLWGWGLSRAIGDGTEEIRRSPVKIADNVKKFYRSSARYAPNYIIKTDNTLWGWGEHGYVNKDSDLNDVYIGIGDGTTETRLSPVKILDNVREVRASGEESRFYYYNKGQKYSYRRAYNVYAVTNDNALWTWGANLDGELLDGTEEAKLSPVKVMTNVKGVMFDESGFGGSAVQWFVIKTDNTLWGWGSDYRGRLGIGNAVDNEKYVENPTKISDDVKELYPTISGIDEEISNFVLKKDNSLWAWGCNNYSGESNRLGLNSDTDYITTPTMITNDVKTLYPVDKVAIKSDNTLWEWGYFNGESKPIHKVCDNAASYCSAEWGAQRYIIKNDGTLWAWGHTYKLGIGDSSENYISAPVQILFDDANDATQPPEIAVDKTSNSSTHTFDVTLSRPIDYCYVYAAIYDSAGNLININKTSLNTSGSTSVNVSKTSSDKTAKIFVWSDNMQPITETESIDLK